MDRWNADVRFALKGLLRRPGFAALIVTTLALGMGANAAVFSVVNAVLIRALPYPDADRLVMADQLQPTGHRASVAMPNYEDWRDRSTAFDGFAMEKPESFQVEGGRGLEVLDARSVLGDFFEILGVDPVLGALPTGAELGPGAERIVVLTHGLWSARFGASADAIGRTLRIGDDPYRVVAVLPPGYPMARDVALYVPIGLSADDRSWTDRGTSYGGWVVARMRPGVSLDEARADLDRVGRELVAEHGADVGQPAVFTMRDWYVGDLRAPVLFLMGGVALVLLVACANVASLLLGRAEERREEFAVRAALGAGRGRLVSQLLAEAAVFGVLGGMAGLVLARVTLNVLVGVVGTTVPAAFAERVSVDPLVGFVTMVAALGVTVVFALVPALGGSRADGSAALRRTTGAGSGGLRLRGLLVVGEVGLCVVLLVSTGLLIGSVDNLLKIDAGFSAEGVLTQRISLPATRYPDRAAVEAAQQRIAEAAERLPEVTAAAVSNLFPFSGTNWEMLFRDPTRPTDDPESVLFTAASPEYFDVFGIRLVRGRLFDATDRADGEPVVVIDETAAERYWPGEDPIGRRVSVDDVFDGEDFVPLWRTVIGVVQHVRNYELTAPSRIEAYVPLFQSAACCRAVWLTVRTTGDPAALAPTVRGLLRDFDPEIPIYRVNTMQAVLDGETALHRAIRELFVLFGALALALGAVGIYGVVSAGAERRRREIGLRVALGSAPSTAAARVSADGLRWVAAGWVLGIGGAAAAGRVIESMLVGVTPMQPSVVLAASLVLAAAALAAAWIPTLRAARVEPAAVLRQE